MKKGAPKISLFDVTVLRLSKCAVVSQFNQIVQFCYYFYFFTQILDFKSIPVKVGDENVVQVVFGEGKEF